MESIRKYFEPTEKTKNEKEEIKESKVENCVRRFNNIDRTLEEERKVKSDKNRIVDGRQKELGVIEKGNQEMIEKRKSQIVRLKKLEMGNPKVNSTENVSLVKNRGQEKERKVLGNATQGALGGKVKKLED